MNDVRRLGMMMAALILVLAACGGSDDGSDDEDTSAETTQSAAAPAADSESSGSASDETAATEAPAETTTVATDAPDTGDAGGGEDEEGSGPSTASVTLAGETYEFSTEGAIVAQCLTDLFGIMSVQLPMVDGGDGGVSIVALREGTDPEVVGEVNSVEVSIGDDDWIADEADDLYEMSDQLEPGMSQVDSIEIDGRTVRGTATFVRQNSLFGSDEPETLTGSFEATCGEERTS
jgi:hypothetical protein